MYIIYKCKDYDGNTMYNTNSIIGIYDEYNSAKNDLVNKLNKLKYKYEFTIDRDDYCFIILQEKNGKKLTTNPIPCFEIIERKLTMNKIS